MTECAKCGKYPKSGLILEKNSKKWLCRRCYEKQKTKTDK